MVVELYKCTLLLRASRLGLEYTASPHGRGKRKAEGASVRFLRPDHLPDRARTDVNIGGRTGGTRHLVNYTARSNRNG